MIRQIFVVEHFFILSAESPSLAFAKAAATIRIVFQRFWRENENSDREVEKLQLRQQRGQHELDELVGFVVQLGLDFEVVVKDVDPVPRLGDQGRHVEQTLNDDNAR